MPVCKGGSCGAPIIFVKTQTGADLPIDEEPNPEGNVVLEADGKAQVLPPKEAERYTGEKYMPHWKTCPDREKFKARAKKG